jgi:signal peptidase I
MDMLKTIYRWCGLYLERRPWGVHLLYHAIRHYRLYELLEAIGVAFLFAFLLQSFIVQPFKIPSESMEPTLKVGDRIFVNKMAYLFHPPQPGDIVVFKTPRLIYDSRKPIYIKRVAGVEGDSVAIVGGRLYLDGRPPTHPALRQNTYTVRVEDVLTKRPKLYTSEEVPPGQAYLFGDNSPYSYDSRFWGGVPLKNIKGRAFFRWWPVDRIGWIE